MKKLFFIAGVALSLSVNAQTEKGSWMVGGNLGNLNLGFAKSTTDFSIDVEPIGLYFITDNLGIGGRVLLGVSTGEPLGVKTTIFGYGVAPTLRYYFTEMGKGKIFGEAAVDLTGTSTKITGISKTINDNNTGFSLGVGYNYFFNPHVALEAGLRYANKPPVYNAPTAGSENNINVNFGLQIFFPKKSASQVKSSYRKK
jgi:outer membrane protein